MQLFLKYVLPIVLIIRTTSFIISRNYAGIVRFASSKDALRIFTVIISGTVLYVVVNVFTYYFFNKIFIIPFSIIILESLITIFIMTYSRFLIKLIYYEYANPRSNKQNVIIIGNTDIARTAKHAIDNDTGIKYNVVAIIDTTNSYIRNKFEGVNIYKLEMLDGLILKLNVKNVIVSYSLLSIELKNNISETCLNRNVKILNIPETSKWINGELQTNQLSEIKIEDLLQRNTIKLKTEHIKLQTQNNVIMITGAAGSIGREIVFQIVKFKPKLIILFDQAETPLNDLSLELEEIFDFKDYKIIVGDLTNFARIDYIINRYKPTVIYHAAAYKHVPMMEKNPSEAVITNVSGTRNLADIANKYGVERFVMISTDKAVNPTNVMGASKRIAEIYIQSLGSISKTSFITTRFGNVLGSNGSVIPRFRSQIEKGGPITVTHPDITRYFMTIPEACQLVLEAGAMGNGREIFIFDMGKPIKIVDLAKNMIRLSGLTEDKDIKITFTGLRPGEKIYEELLNNKENTIATYHPQIMIAKVIEYNYQEVLVKINKLIETVSTFDNYKIVEQMKNIVPEFKSANSVYEKLDKH